MVMLVPLVVLALGATFAGIAFRYLFIGAGHDGFWRGSLFLGQENDILDQMETAPWLVSLSPTLFHAAWGGGSPTTCISLTGRRPRGSPTHSRSLYRFLAQQVVFRRAL